MCVTVPAPVPLDPPQRASGLRTNGSEAATPDRSVAGQERNQLLHRERGPQPEHGEEEEEGGGAGRTGRNRGGRGRGGRRRETRREKGGGGRPGTLSVRMSEISPQSRTQTTGFRMQMSSVGLNPSVGRRLLLWLTGEIETSGQKPSDHQETPLMIYLESITYPSP